jgi:thiamine pyrophosphokinase
VILNSAFEAHVAQRFWRQAHLTMCADGAANRLFDGMPVLLRSKYIPQYIVGDLDSIRPEVMVSTWLIFRTHASFPSQPHKIACTPAHTRTRVVLYQLCGC